MGKASLSPRRVPVSIICVTGGLSELKNRHFLLGRTLFLVKTGQKSLKTPLLAHFRYFSSTSKRHRNQKTARPGRKVPDLSSAGLFYNIFRVARYQTTSSPQFFGLVVGFGPFSLPCYEFFNFFDRFLCKGHQPHQTFANVVRSLEGRGASQFPLCRAIF